ncbi:hypothetical protein CR513_21698, partial [Mucuna pruriens]
MARFLHGLKKDIQNIVELYRYAIMDDLKGKEKEERPRKDKSPKGSSISQGQEKERMLPSPALVSKSSNIKFFKYLGKGHITS